MKKTYFKGQRSGNYVQVKVNSDALEDLQATLMSKFVTRVGILGSKVSRNTTITTKQGFHKAGKVASPKTNAEIGLLHEKGSLTQHIPRRSFLEMPLIMHSEGLKSIKESLVPVFSTTDSIGKRKSMWRQAYVKLGMLAENIVQTAFESRGFGQWAPDSAGTIKRKHSDQPLIDTAQLRRSITSDVVAK